MNLSDKFENIIQSDILQANHLLENKHHKKKIIAGAAISGFLAGFAAAILLAPESGSELRRDLSKILHETNEKLVQLATETIKKNV